MTRQRICSETATPLMERHEDAFMDNLYESTYLPDILHDIAQGLLVPTMVVVVALIVVSLFFIGQIIVEAFTERSQLQLVSYINFPINFAKFISWVILAILPFLS